MKRNFLIWGLFTFSLFAFSQDNQKGIEYYKSGLFDFSKTFFDEQKSSNSSVQAEKYYYLGLISIAENTDSASYFFNRSIEIDPKSPWGYLGNGRLNLIKKDVIGSTKEFNKAEKLGKKNPEVALNIADAYFSNKDKEQANIYIEKAKKINSEYSGIYLLEGDFLMQEERVGDAMGKYEQAQYFDTKNKLATLKLARMYVKMNRKDLAIDQLNSIFASDANNIPAKIIFGEIKNSEGKYKEAISTFETVIQAGNAPVNVYERYAQALYFDKQYSKSLSQINNSLQKNPNNLVSKRIRAYNNFELKNYSETVQDLESMISNANPKNIIYQDYLTLGKASVNILPKKFEGKTLEDTLTYVKERNRFINSFKKAIELKPEIAETYKEFANAYYSIFEYQDAVPLFEKYFELNKNHSTMDLYVFSDACYNAAQVNLRIFINDKNANTQQLDSVKNVMNNYINSSVNANEQIIGKDTNLYIGYYGKARTRAILDDFEKATVDKIPGIAKPDYEIAIEKMLKQNENGKLNSNIIDGYNYLSAYYIKNGDIKSTIEVNKKILEIDPTNEWATYVLKKLSVKQPDNKATAKKKK